MERVEILIIGAGPTGLGAAWQLDRLAHDRWLLCEAAASAGGLASSVVDEHGFTWDLGGHVQFSHYDYFDQVMDDLLDVDGWLYHERESWVWLRDTFVPYPFQLNLHRLPADDQRRSVRGLIRAAVRAAADGEAPPAHFDEWIERAFGGGLADVFMRPYNLKVWAYPLDLLSWGWIGDRVALVDLPRVVRNMRDGRDDVSWGPNNAFRFPKRGGTGAIWRELARRLAERHPGRLRFGRRLTFIDTARREAHFDTGGSIRYERLLSSVPLDSLVAGSDAPDRLRAAASALRYSSTHVVGIGLHGSPPAALAGKCWMYFPEANCPFYRVTVFSHYSPNNVPDIRRYWSLMAEVAESPHKPVARDRVAADVVNGLLATGLVRDRADVHHTWHHRLERGYPTPTLTRDAALDTLLPALEARGIYSRGRFGAWKYEVSNQDHSFAQGVEVIDRWLAGKPEPTLNCPEVVNANRPKKDPERKEVSRTRADRLSADQPA